MKIKYNQLQGALSEAMGNGSNVNPLKEIKERRRKKLRIRHERKKKKQRKKIPKQYQLYIQSKFWERRRNIFFQKYGRKCAVCGSSHYVQLHHAYYGDYGFEQDEHLVPLCEVHHLMFHEQYGKTRKNMIRATLKFVDDNFNIICR